MRRAVLELTSSRPVWSVPDEAVAAIRHAFGTTWEVVHVAAATSSDGDGAGGTPDAVRAAVGAEVYMGWGVPVPVLRAGAGSLHWVHTAAAGVRGSLSPELVASGVVFTNSRGVQAEPMADWVVAAIGFCARGFHLAVAAQARQEWAKAAFTEEAGVVREFRDLAIGLVGLGGIGEAVARRCLALGMTVRAVRRRPEAACQTKGIDWVGGPADLVRLARHSDVLVVTAAQTRETTALIGEAVIAALPPGACVVNVARGGLVDEAALLRGLETGRVAGCVLDVVAVEPLPSDHPFWRHPRVLLTPHVSAVSTHFWERETALIVDNVERYRNGRSLRSVVDFELGY